MGERVGKRYWMDENFVRVCLIFVVVVFKRNLIKMVSKKDLL